MIRRTPLKRSQKPLKRTPIRKVSKKQAARNAELSRIKKGNEYGECQCGCGRFGWLQQAHIVRRSDGEKEQVNPENMIYMLDECHDIFDQGPMQKRWDRLPNFQMILDRMKKIDINYYNRFINLLK